VNPVGQLDKNHASVLAHRQKHFAERFRLAIFAVAHTLDRGLIKLGQLGHAVHQHGDLFAELDFEIVNGQRSVLDGIVKQTGGNRGRIQVEIRENTSDRVAVSDIWLAAIAPLLSVCGLGQSVGAPELVLRLRAVGLAGAPDNLFHCGSSDLDHIRAAPIRDSITRLA